MGDPSTGALAVWLASAWGSASAAYIAVTVINAVIINVALNATRFRDADGNEWIIDSWAAGD